MFEARAEETLKNTRIQIRIKRASGRVRTRRHHIQSSTLNATELVNEEMRYISVVYIEEDKREWFESSHAGGFRKNQREKMKKETRGGQKTAC